MCSKASCAFSCSSPSRKCGSGPAEPHRRREASAPRDQRRRGSGDLPRAAGHRRVRLRAASRGARIVPAGFQPLERTLADITIGYSLAFSTLEAAVEFPELGARVAFGSLIADWPYFLAAIGALLWLWRCRNRIDRKLEYLLVAFVVCSLANVAIDEVCSYLVPLDIAGTVRPTAQCPAARPHHRRRAVARYPGARLLPCSRTRRKPENVQHERLNRLDILRRRRHVGGSRTSASSLPACSKVTVRQRVPEKRPFASRRPPTFSCTWVTPSAASVRKTTQSPARPACRARRASPSRAACRPGRRTSRC